MIYSETKRGCPGNIMTGLTVVCLNSRVGVIALIEKSGCNSVQDIRYEISKVFSNEMQWTCVGGFYVYRDVVG